MELLSAQQKREFFAQIEELLRPLRRRPKPATGDQTTEATGRGAEMRDLKKLGALQQEKRPSDRKPQGPATVVCSGKLI
ncbi:hypothetical protein F442_20668 [Phytophthora nicotianae P10297]|uniref:Uncharacterized protein n=1 Tax=Phytophthora nicotianae P10297 TaxID=1317064 RepID=W2Y5D8_PHYNI|nr:hypothetical protein F442_20668 [Phytophthora nicotianae P10297]